LSRCPFASLTLQEFMTHLQSPSFKPTRLGFDEDQLRTPNGNRAHSFYGNKENEAPLSAAKDAQIKQWIAHKNLEHLFRTKQEMSAAMKLIKIYSMDFQDKVAQLIEAHNELKEYQATASDEIERYKRREKELRRSHESLDEELRSAQSEYKQIQFEIENKYKPKLEEYTTLSYKYSAAKRECDALLNEKKAWTQSKREYEQKLSRLTEEISQLKKPSFSFSTGTTTDDDSDIASRSASQKPAQQILQHSSAAAAVATAEQWTALSKKLDTFMLSQQRATEAQSNQCQLLQASIQAYMNEAKDDRRSTQLNANISAASDFGLTEKCDELLSFMKAQKIEQRIVTMYKKIIEQFERKFTENKEMAQQTLNHKFESQRVSIENLLATFRASLENEFVTIQQSILPPPPQLPVQEDTHDNNNNNDEDDDGKPKIGQSLSPISTKKDPSPLSTDSILKEMDTALDDRDAQAMNNMMEGTNKNILNVNDAIETRCARLNELVITEFVMVLVHNIRSASDIGFEKLVTVMMKMVNRWIHIHVDAVMTKLASLFRLDDGVSRGHLSHKMEAFLGELKTEINHMFIKLFQTTLNNTLDELVPCKMEKIQIQSKIARLTQQLQAPPHSTVNTLSSVQNKKIKKQLQPISLEKIIRNIFVVLLLIFMAGIAFGYVLLPRPQCHCFGHSF